MKGMSRFTTVFAFTFRRATGTRGWRTMTILVAALLFLLPGLLPTVVDRLNHSPAEPPTGGSSETLSQTAELQSLYIVDETPGAADWSVLELNGGATQVLCCDSLADVQQMRSTELCLHVTLEDGAYVLSLLYGADSAWEDQAGGILSSILEQFDSIRLQKAGLSQEQQQTLSVELSTPVEMELLAAEERAPNAEMLEILNMALPYLIIMLLYFMVLFYGQSVATSAIAEKTSKLMDTFLVSVSPKAMMLGKVLAVSLSAVLQLGLWVVALIGGLIAGRTLLLAVNPASTSGYLGFIDAIRSLSGLFDPAGVVIGVAIMLAGFLLYCSLAAIGGALASKPEELSSTNLLFTMALVISFFVCLFGGGLMNGEGINLSWVDWVPFTAILATPSRLMLGQLQPLAGLGSLAIVLVTAVLFCALAGKLYQMMSFYRGTLPKPGQLIKMWKK